MKPAYRTYLTEEFERRRARNPSYSLRAYARDLAVPAPKLSQYLGGACGISGKRAQAMASTLKLSDLETELFVASAEASHARNKAAKSVAQDKVQRLLASMFTSINMEKFALIRDWHYIAILELLGVRSLQSNVGWIAEQLGLPERVVAEAVDRLERLGYVDRSEARWRDVGEHFDTPPNISSRAIREYHQQILRKAEESLETVAPDQREFGTVTYAVDQDLLPEMKTLVRKFLRDAAVIASRSQKKDSVYSLAAQLFPIYQEKK